MTYVPEQITETTTIRPQLGGWTTCNLAASTMGAAKATLGMIPSTVAEMRRLWALIGTSYSGFTADQVAAGQARLYGRQGSWSIDRPDSWRARLAQPSVGVVFYGDYQALPSGIRILSRDPRYAGGHALYGQAVEATPGAVRVADPLSVSGFALTTIDQLDAFARTHDYEHVSYPEGAWLFGRFRDLGPDISMEDREDMAIQTRISVPPDVGRLFPVKPGTVLREGPGEQYPEHWTVPDGTHRFALLGFLDGDTSSWVAAYRPGGRGVFWVPPEH